MAARKLVDFVGPLGWEASCVSTGRSERLPGEPAKGVEVRVRAVQRLVELRALFELKREDIDAAARGAKDPDLDAVREAAAAGALAEDRAIFHGFAAAGIRGVTEAASGAALPLSDDYAAYPGVVAEAISKLHDAGVGGPYAIALGSRCYTGLTKTAKNGFPVMEHVRRLLDGPIVWAPAIDGAAVLSQRGGDFELTASPSASSRPRLPSRSRMASAEASRIAAKRTAGIFAKDVARRALAASRRPAPRWQEAAAQAGIARAPPGSSGRNRR
jgi:uncharacterized linocin/CFP29 family protein